VWLLCRLLRCRLLSASRVALSVAVSPTQPLPVRHREFLKSVKKHYAKLLLVLQVCGDCKVAPGVWLVAPPLADLPAPACRRTP
jgi:hypothetical protein